MGLFQDIVAHPGVILSCIVGIFAVSWIIEVVKESRRLWNFKGPRISSWTRLWLARTSISGRQAQMTAEALQKYGGKVIRTSPNDLITIDTDLYRRMSSARSTYSRSEFYKAFKFNPELDNIISEIDEEKHTKLRARVAPGYAGKENLHLEDDIDSCLQNLISLIDTKYKSSPSAFFPIDFARTINFMTLDVITKLAFGSEFGYLSTDSDVFSWIKTLEENLPGMQVISAFPWMGRLIRHPLLIKYMFPSDKDPMGVGKVMNTARDLVGERFGPDAKHRSDMLGSFINHGLSQKEAESEAVIQILAGSDTTAIAARFTMLQICTRPQVFSALRQEVDNTDAAGNINKPIIKDAEAKQMPYLQACIKEGLRLCPSVVGPMGKEVPAGGDVIDGHFVPAGVRVGVNIYLIGRDKEVYGPDAELFRPERWLESSPERIRVMEKQNELVFGYGKYSCLGKSIAFMELNKIFVELLRRYDMTPIDVSKPWEYKEFGVHLHRKMMMRFIDRADGKRSEDI